MKIQTPIKFAVCVHCQRSFKRSVTVKLSVLIICRLKPCSVRIINAAVSVFVHVRLIFRRLRNRISIIIQFFDYIIIYIHDTVTIHIMVINPYPFIRIRGFINSVPERLQISIGKQTITGKIRYIYYLWTSPVIHQIVHKVIIVFINNTIVINIKEIYISALMG